MLKAVIFDVDGVLVDSREANIHLYQELLSRGGYSKPSREAVLECFHVPLRGSIELLAPGISKKEVERLLVMVNTADIRDADLLKFPEKLAEVLQELHRSYQLAIVTSRIRLGMDDVFSRTNIQDLFDAVITYEDYDKPKPDPEPLLVALEKLSVSAEEAIYVGDSDTDIMAATAAGMRSIHLSRSVHQAATAGILEFEELVGAIRTLART